MKNSWFLLLLVFCTSCLSLTTLQSGRTVGRNNFNTALTSTYGRYLDAASIDNGTNENLVTAPSFGLDMQVGLRNRTDLQVHMDLASFIGVGLKQQIIGDAYSRFAGSIGADLGINMILGIARTRSFYFTAPLYTSYEVSEKFTLCLTPRFLYQDRSYYDSPYSGGRTYVHHSYSRLGMSYGFLLGRNTKFGLEISNFGGAFFQPTQVSAGLIFHFNADREKRQRKQRLIRRQVI